MVEPNWVWGVIEMTLLCALAMTGMHIFIVLGAIGVSFAILYYGDIRAIKFIGGSAFTRTAEYAMSMVPLFLLMGAWVEKAGLGRDAYDSCMKWLARVKGSLADVAIVAQAIFGTVTGSALASAATIGGISLPEMKRYGYSAALRTGSIASGAMLSNLIPPSTIAIYYALLTDESVGKLFIAGVIPGIILTLLFMLVVYVWVTLRPADAPMLPPDVHFTFKEKIKSSATLIPIAIIFLVLIGGIYLGWFGPTEAAGIGAFTVMIVCLAYRRLTWVTFNDALLSTVRTSGMVLMLLVGAFIFSHTLALTEISKAIGGLIAHANLGYIPLMYIIVLVLVIVGIPLDGFVFLIFTVPVLYSVVTTSPGAPPMASVWFGTLLVLLVMFAQVTPPMANLLYLAQMIDGCPTRDVIIGALPFYTSTAVLIVLMIHFPWLVTWLPSKMLGG
ncbi:MAG: TRAP transporter large permease [Chloroflexota bacterium]